MTKYYAMLVTSHPSQDVLPEYMYSLCIGEGYNPVLSAYHMYIGEFAKPFIPKICPQLSNQYLNDIVVLPDGSTFITKSEMYNAFKTTKLFLK